MLTIEDLILGTLASFIEKQKKSDSSYTLTKRIYDLCQMYEFVLVTWLFSITANRMEKIIWLLVNFSINMKANIHIHCVFVQRHRNIKWQDLPKLFDQNLNELLYYILVFCSISGLILKAFVASRENLEKNFKVIRMQH